MLPAGVVSNNEGKVVPTEIIRPVGGVFSLFQIKFVMLQP